MVQDDEEIEVQAHSLTRVGSNDAASAGSYTRQLIEDRLTQLGASAAAPERARQGGARLPAEKRREPVGALPDGRQCGQSKSLMRGPEHREKSL